VDCTGANRGLLTICTNSTVFLPVYVSMVAVNCDPLGSPATHDSRLPSCSIFIQRTETISVLSLDLTSRFVPYILISQESSRFE
jgi:hypothetical protein